MSLGRWEMQFESQRDEEVKKKLRRWEESHAKSEGRKGATNEVTNS